MTMTINDVLVIMLVVFIGIIAVIGMQLWGIALMHAATKREDIDVTDVTKRLVRRR